MNKLLQKIAEVIKKECREDDIIARIGGDEFIILLPKADSDATKNIIKRIKRMIKNEKVGYPSPVDSEQK